MINYEGEIRLSILIPSIIEREHLFSPLIIELQNQINKCYTDHPALGTSLVHTYITETFTNGGLSIGKKREWLLNIALGTYICFLDDDDQVSPDYIETLLRLCYEDKDVCTFRNFSTFDNYWTVVDMDLEHEENEQATPENIVKRKPWHICPVKAEHAKGIEFPDSNYGEDWVWFEQVLKNCKTQAKTNKIIHRYNHSLNHSAADNG